MEIHIVRVQPWDVAPDSPRVVIVVSGAADSILARFRAAATGSSPLLAGSAVAIVRSVEVSDADEVAVLDVSSAESEFTIALDYRRFSGPRAASVVEVALIEVLLGTLRKGDYRLRLREVIRYFSRAEDASPSPPPSTTELVVPFSVHG